MKHLDPISKRILAIGASISMVLLALTLFLNTTPFAKAEAGFPDQLSAETMDSFQAAGVQSIGKYRMEYQLIYDPGNSDYAHFILVYDTETAASKMYYRDGDYKLSSGQLPEKPI